ncbi:hypothetical protein HMPREF9603_00590 [Cutibacterium acnes HL001PA1]|nr:hypothetical protein HMPREF9603_00590 [Cutibacterium acnes HL001PA1]EFT10107.1 hypothetical protein HMPREF9619_01444 [Cutibacterium acnes HL082PA2]EFT76147.1 hypothetical protein HMPREF9599_02576 [Cutibacterium acnes HL050PA2]EGE69754.1 hypothetical protein HMPREF9341_01036 [Cutibacterium acnes HL103PA1]
MDAQASWFPPAAGVCDDGGLPAQLTYVGWRRRHRSHPTM